MGDCLAYLLSSIAWSLVGLVVGFYLGRLYPTRKKE